MSVAFKAWLSHYLGNEEAVALCVMLAACVAVMWTLGGLLAPFIASFVIAFVLHGMVVALGRHLPRMLAVGITFTLFLGFFIALLLFLVPALWQQAGAALADWPQLLERARHGILQWADQYPDLITREYAEQALTQINPRLLELSERALASASGWVPGVIVTMLYLVLVPVVVFFLLKDWPQLVAVVRQWLPNQSRALQDIVGEMDSHIADYMRGKAIEIIIIGTLAWLIFALFGLRYALFLGVLVGLSVLVPYVGAFSVTVPVALVGFLQFGWSGTLGYMMLCYLVLQVLDGNLLVPLLFSEVVDMHPVTIILAVLLFGGLLGFWGVFFAIPLAAFLRALVRFWPTDARRC